MTIENAEQVKRVSVAAMDEILGMPFSVLDKGLIRVVDYFGGDEAICQAARVSYGKGTKSRHDDEGLIRYLMRKRHSTPFEMCELKLHVRVPMDAWRQWIRHRTANVNEYSTRYSVAIDDKQQTRPDAWRRQSQTNKQGSADFIETSGQELTQRECDLHTMANAVYQQRIDAGVAREQARKDLPLSTYTEAYWKIDLHNLLHFLALRMDAHAQLEIRSYADVIGQRIVARWVPLTWQAFLDYRLNAITLTARDQIIVKCIVHDNWQEAIGIARGQFGWLTRGKKGWTSNRERQECEAKLDALELTIPWTD